MIRKRFNPKLYKFPWVFTLLGITFIIVAISSFICLQTINIENHSKRISNTLFEVISLIIPLFFLYFWVTFLKDSLSINKSKKLKGNWKGIISKVKISSIEYYANKLTRDPFEWYRLQAKNWDIIYKSETIELKMINRLLIDSDLTYNEIYWTYWYKYNKNETHKKDVIREINKRISEKQWKSKNIWLSKKSKLKKDLSILQEDKKLVEEWYQNPFLEINWHKISVWDTVDVYIDPDDEKNYWMDIDFLFDQ